jgi:hypothetical protein
MNQILKCIVVTEYEKHSDWNDIFNDFTYFYQSARMD